VSVHAVKDASRPATGCWPDLRDKHMVLVDTVGMSQRDRAVSEQLAMLCGMASGRCKRLLLLNASSHGDTLERGGAGVPPRRPRRQRLGPGGLHRDQGGRSPRIPAR
jgi:hypothetical protein